MTRIFFCSDEFVFNIYSGSLASVLYSHVINHSNGRTAPLNKAIKLVVSFDVIYCLCAKSITLCGIFLDKIKVLSFICVRELITDLGELLLLLCTY